MKLIIIPSQKKGSKNILIGPKKLMAIIAVGFCVPLVLGVISYQFSFKIDNPEVSKAIAKQWQQNLAQDKASLEALKLASQEKLDALTVKLAEAQGRLIRLEALGDRLAAKGKLDNGEFDFSSRPAIGGLEESLEGGAFEKADFVSDIDSLIASIEQQEHQMLVLESILDDRLMAEDVFVAGRPINKGWMSSFYGRRIDPFSGKLAQHKGVDFAGKEGAEVVAVASGVITWSGERYGYGLLVEVDHGGGFQTRYAHNKENVVELGDIVKKGQVLAKMGSTGRSTGPHVHFEVIRNGRAVNPERYVYR